MLKKQIILLLTLFLLLPITSFAEGKYSTRFEKQTTLEHDTELAGRIYIATSIIVPKGVTLTILPGAVIEFGHPGFSEDGNVSSSIIVEGKLKAVGSAKEPILFTSATKKEKSSFGELYFNDAQASLFQNCRFEFSHWALHVHDSEVTVTESVFENCFGGIRFKGNGVTATNNEFRNIDIGFRFWQGGPVITDNLFDNVGTAIFAREKVVSPTITKNKFRNITDYTVKLGELQEDDITIEDNDFGSDDEKVIRDKIFDKAYEDYIGKVIIK